MAKKKKVKKSSMGPRLKSFLKKKGRFPKTAAEKRAAGVSSKKRSRRKATKPRRARSPRRASRRKSPKRRVRRVARRRRKKRSRKKMGIPSIASIVVAVNAANELGLVGAIRDGVGGASMDTIAANFTGVTAFDLVQAALPAVIVKYLRKFVGPIKAGPVRIW